MQFIYAVGGPAHGIWLEGWRYIPNSTTFTHDNITYSFNSEKCYRKPLKEDKCYTCGKEIPPGIKLALLMEAVRVGHIEEK